MKKDKDNEINEKSIKSLIRYAEDDNETADDTYDKESETEYDVFDDNYKTADKKISKKAIIAGIIIGLIAIIAFIGIDSGAIGKYKNNFASNFSSMFPKSGGTGEQSSKQPSKKEETYKTTISKRAIVALEEANTTKFAKYNDGIVCAGMNRLFFINKNGETVWDINTAVVNPILQAEGNYILIAERGGKKACLYSGGKLLYDVNDPDPILSAKLSSKGDAVLITDRPSYRGGISVYNRSGSQIFSWASGSDRVICADISASSRRLAVSLLNTEGKAKSVILLFNVNETDSYSKTEIENSVIFDMDFTGKVLNAFGDNCVVGISEKGRIVYQHVLGETQLNHFAVDKNGNKLLFFDDGNMPTINRYNKNGSLKESMVLAGVADYIDIHGKKILYNKGRDVIFGRMNSGSATKYTAAMDIKNLLIVSNNTFVIVYSNSLEVVTV